MRLLLLITLANLTSFCELDKQERIYNSIGAASVGDALGRVTEFISSTAKIFNTYPYGVRSCKDFLDSDWSYLPTKFKSRDIAPYTDDTAMAVLVFQALQEADSKEMNLDETMALIAELFVLDRYRELGWVAPFRAPGVCTQKYVSILAQKLEFKKELAPIWWKVSPANGVTGGCGSVMRAYPFGLVFSDNPEKAKVWAAEHSELTHGDLCAKAACAAMAVGTAYALQDKDQEFILNQMILAASEYDFATAAKMTKARNYALSILSAICTARVGMPFRSCPCNSLHRHNVFKALKDDKHWFRKKHDKFFESNLGWSATDAISCVVYLFTLFPDDLENAIFIGVHTPGDSDSIASLAGALIGARIKDKSFKEKFVDNNTCQVEDLDLKFIFTKVLNL